MQPWASLKLQRIWFKEPPSASFKTTKSICSRSISLVNNLSISLKVLPPKPWWSSRTPTTSSVLPPRSPGIQKLLKWESVLPTPCSVSNRCLTTCHESPTSGICKIQISQKKHFSHHLLCVPWLSTTNKVIFALVAHTMVPSPSSIPELVTPLVLLSHSWPPCSKSLIMTQFTMFIGSLSVRLVPSAYLHPLMANFCGGTSTRRETKKTFVSQSRVYSLRRPFHKRMVLPNKRSLEEPPLNIALMLGH